MILQVLWRAVVVGIVAVLALGCGGPAPRQEQDHQRSAQAVISVDEGREMRAQLLAGAVLILNALDRYDEARGSEQVFDRLVQWSHAAGSLPSSAPDPLFESLPAHLRKAAEGILTRATFDVRGDVIAIRDRCWLAAVARTAQGDAVDDLAVAQNLFRWTVRSLAPVGDPPMVPTDAAPGSRWFLPGEIMLAGRASGPQRAWVFVELLRQAGLEGVILATPNAGGGPPRPWLPALVSGGEAYLFEPTFGMPVPGPGGVGIATVRQAAEDPAILATLAVGDRPYPVTAADVRNVGVLVVADPWTLSPRMAKLDREFAPTQGIRLSVDATSIAARAAAALPAGDEATRSLWTFPWETIARRQSAIRSLADEVGALDIPLPGSDERGRAAFRPLFAGRVREFRGDLDGPTGAKAAYMAARPSRRMMAEGVRALPEQQGAAVIRGLTRMKEDATYWLGLVMLSEGQCAAAVDYLERMTLETSPDSRWTDGARINLATALVGLGRPREAAAILREDSSPQRFGSRLLAERLEEAGRQAPEPPPEASLPQP